MKRHESWIKQAHEEFRFGQVALDAGFFPQACFIAQQVAEKALKSLAFFRKAELVKSHSVVGIARALGINGKLESYGRQLDLYYLSARYPDALPDNLAPVDYFSKDQADEALKMAAEFLRAASDEMSK